MNTRLFAATLAASVSMSVLSSTAFASSKGKEEADIEPLDQSMVVIAPKPSAPAPQLLTPVMEEVAVVPATESLSELLDTATTQIEIYSSGGPEIHGEYQAYLYHSLELLTQQPVLKELLNENFEKLDHQRQVLQSKASVVLSQIRDILNPDGKATDPILQESFFVTAKAPAGDATARQQLEASHAAKMASLRSFFQTLQNLPEEAIGLKVEATLASMYYERLVYARFIRDLFEPKRGLKEIMFKSEADFVVDKNNLANLVVRVGTAFHKNQAAAKADADYRHCDFILNELPRACPFLFDQPKAAPAGPALKIQEPAKQVVAPKKAAPAGPALKIQEPAKQQAPALKIQEPPRQVASADLPTLLKETKQLVKDLNTGNLPEQQLGEKLALLVQKRTQLSDSAEFQKAINQAHVAQSSNNDEAKVVGKQLLDHVIAMARAIQGAELKLTK